MSRISSTYGKPYYSKKDPIHSEKVRSSSPLRHSRSMTKISATVEDGVCKHVRRSNSASKEKQAYIKELQQQIYVLELENNHLRQQTMKAIEIKPEMDKEAHNMMEKLRALQMRIDYIQNEIYRKDAEMQSLNRKFSELTSVVKTEKGGQNIEQDRILADVIAFRQTRDQLQSELAVKDIELIDLRTEKEKRKNQLIDSDLQVQALRTQLQHEMEKFSDVENSLAEKRSDMMRMEGKIKHFQDNIATSRSSVHSAAIRELQEELSMVRGRLREVELMSNRDKELRASLTADTDHLVTENGRILAEIDQLRTRVEDERRSRQVKGSQRTQEKEMLEKLKRDEKLLMDEVASLKRRVSEERTRATRLGDQASKQEEIYAKQALEVNMTKKRATQMDFVREKVAAENEKMKADKENLVEHIRQLQQNIREKSVHLESLQSGVRELEERLDNAEYERGAGDRLQGIKWGELEEMASVLKQHAHEMASTTSASHQFTTCVDVQSDL